VIRLPRLSGSGNGVSTSTKLFNKDVRLTNHKGNGSLGVLLDDGSDGVDVFLVLVETIISNLVLAVGRKRRAVTVGQVVDNESAHDRRGSTSGVLRLDVSEVSVHGRDLGGGVAVRNQSLILKHDSRTNSQPHERAKFGNSAGLSHQARRQRRDRERLNFRSVVRVGVDLLAGEWVA
jgi:hypothetical protein